MPTAISRQAYAAAVRSTSGTRDSASFGRGSAEAGGSGGVDISCPYPPGPSDREAGP